MFRAFELGLEEGSYQQYYAAGQRLHQAERERIKARLDDFKLEEGPLDGSLIQRLWFPFVDAEVFLSHSHQDEKDVIALAGYLHEELDLRSFIDSSIWGCATELLKKIDNEHCYVLPERAFYDYNKRNNSTSHVHMMLSTALGMMIDATECAVFLNTPRSISAQDAIEGRTKSPWIYSELAMINVVRRRKISSHRQEGMRKTAQLRNFSESQLDIDYLAPRAALRRLTQDTLDTWEAKYQGARWYSEGEHPLDVLYNLVAA